MISDGQIAVELKCHFVQDRSLKVDQSQEAVDGRTSVSRQEDGARQRKAGL